MDTKYLVFHLGLILAVDCKTLTGVILNKTFTLGYLMSWDHAWTAGPFIGSSIVVGLEEIEHRGLLPGYHVRWVLGNTWCQPNQGIKETIRIWKEVEDLDAIIGGGCSVVCEPVSLLAASWEIPVISYGCGSDKLSDKHVYPTFSRTCGVYLSLAPVFDSLCELFGWTTIGIISDVIHMYLNLAVATGVLMRSNGREVIHYSVHSTTEVGINEEKLVRMREVVQLLKPEVRVILILMSPMEVRNILTLMYDEGMLNGEYVVFSPDSTALLSSTFAYRPELGLDLLQGFIDIHQIYQDVEKEDQINDFKQRVIDTLQIPAFDHLPRVSRNASVSVVNNFAGLVHDAVLAWAYGVNKTLEQGYSPDNGFKVTENIFNLTFEGITGTVVIDEKGDRKPNYKIQMVQNGNLITIMEWIASGSQLRKVYKPESPDDWSGLLWPGNGTSPPTGIPRCGWSKELCEDGSPSHLLVVLITCAIISIMLVKFSFLVRRARYEREVEGAKSCLVNHEDIHIIAAADVTGSVITSRSHNTSWSENRHQFFIQTARYKNEVVALKNLGDTSLNINDRKLLQELKVMKVIQHENVVSFIGICLDPGHTALLLSYCTRGSLQDVIAEKAVNLTWDFKLSLVTDISQGMRYLHSLLGFHGNLTSSNCLIDGRWTCKVSDFGLCYARGNSSMGLIREKQLINKLWWAPELLRNPQIRGTKKGDVYALAIIIQEVVLEADPYYSNSPPLEPSATVEKIKLGNPLYRPTIPEGVCSEEWHNLMIVCWSEAPEDRPSFLQILQHLQTINGGKSLSLVDSMITKLENHTRHLEDIVMERSIQLSEEKSKMEMLLMELLPQSVFTSLKVGKQVVPEIFENVTIFFSDVVGFTSISAAATPMQVVQMLNLMYTLFDQVSVHFDVYKVATIGDAYFVASGVPVKNDNHFEEICGMAVALLTAAETFPIEHVNETLRLRIGIHSGTCVAGVSAATAKYLASSPKFSLAERGPTFIKGCGELFTYWLSKTVGIVSSTHNLHLMDD